MTTDSLTPAAPPADLEEETFVLNGLITEDLPLTVDDVPPIALMDGEKIVRHPVDDTEVTWKFVGLRSDEDGRKVVEYRTQDDEVKSFTVTDPKTRFTVEVGQVLR
jgi:hypothetical protein